jgi:hypothetical protein
VIGGRLYLVHADAAAELTLRLVPTERYRIGREIPDRRPAESVDVCVSWHRCLAMSSAACRLGRVELEAEGLFSSG